MEFIRKYQLKKNDDGYMLILYLDMNLTEFADEFGSEREEKNNIAKFIEEIIKVKFPNNDNPAKF